jgi:hypothetical protein
MADIMASIEEDDDSRAFVPRRKKRQIIDSDPEDAFNVPEEITCNPMAPAAKKPRRLDVEKSPCSVPPLLPLQPTAPTQVPPNFRPNPVPKARFHLQSTSESRPQPQFRPQQQESRPQSATSKPSRIPDEDDPMQEDHENEEKSPQRGRDHEGPSGWFLLFSNFSTQTQLHYRL